MYLSNHLSSRLTIRASVALPQLQGVHFPRHIVVEGRAFCFVWYKDQGMAIKGKRGMDAKYKMMDGKGSNAILAKWRKSLCAAYHTTPDPTPRAATVMGDKVRASSTRSLAHLLMDLLTHSLPHVRGRSERHASERNEAREREREADE